MSQEESPRRFSVLGGLLAGVALGVGLVLAAAPSRARTPLPPRRWRGRARRKRPFRRRTRSVHGQA
jgi:hypothetical protein